MGDRTIPNNKTNPDYNIWKVVKPTLISKSADCDISVFSFYVSSRFKCHYKNFHIHNKQGVNSRTYFNCKFEFSGKRLKIFFVCKNLISLILLYYSVVLLKFCALELQETMCLLMEKFKVGQQNLCFDSLFRFNILIHHFSYKNIRTLLHLLANEIWQWNTFEYFRDILKNIVLKVINDLFRNRNDILYENYFWQTSNVGGRALDECIWFLSYAALLHLLSPPCILVESKYEKNVSVYKIWRQIWALNMVYNIENTLL